MYLDNPQKLFDELTRINALKGWMKTTEHFKQHLNIDTLVSIVKDEMQKHEQGLSHWSPENASTMAEYAIRMEDLNRLKNIHKQIEKELKTAIKCKYCGSYSYGVSIIFSEDYGYIAYCSCSTCKGGVKTTNEYGGEDYCGTTRHEAKKNVIELYRKVNMENDDSLRGFIQKPYIHYIGSK